MIICRSASTPSWPCAAPAPFVTYKICLLINCSRRQNVKFYIIFSFFDTWFENLLWILQCENLVPTFYCSDGKALWHFKDKKFPWQLIRNTCHSKLVTQFFGTQPASPHDHTFDGAVVHLGSDCDRQAALYLEKVHQKPADIATHTNIAKWFVNTTCRFRGS